LLFEQAQGQGGIKGRVKNRPEVLAQSYLHGDSPFHKVWHGLGPLGRAAIAHNGRGKALLLRVCMYGLLVS
jgi:hypothetical protein